MTGDDGPGRAPQGLCSHFPSFREKFNASWSLSGVRASIRRLRYPGRCHRQCLVSVVTAAGKKAGAWPSPLARTQEHDPESAQGWGAWGPTGRKSKLPPPPASGPVSVHLSSLLEILFASFFFFFFFKLSASDLTSNVTSSGRTERSHRRARAGAATKLILPTLSHDQCEGMEGFPGGQSVYGGAVHWRRASLVPDE